jgi:hypothetical protein
MGQAEKRYKILPLITLLSADQATELMASFAGQRSSAFICGKAVLPWLSLQVYGQIDLRLSLQALVFQLGDPSLRFAVKLHHAVLHGLVVAFADVLQRDSLPIVLGHGKAYAVGGAIGWQSRAPTRVAQIAEIPQLSVRRVDFFLRRAARPAEACAQRQPRGKGPANSVGLFCGIEKRTSHGQPILCDSDGELCRIFF